MQRNIGRLLLSLAAIITAVAPVLADWNESHIFSKQWSPHARFHGVAALCMALILSPMSLWLLWRRTPDPDTAATVAALVPISYWGPFFIAAAVPGTAFEDPGHHLPRVAGVPTNVLGAAASVLTAATGWYLDRRLRVRD